MITHSLTVGELHLFLKKHIKPTHFNQRNKDSGWYDLYSINLTSSYFKVLSFYGDIYIPSADSKTGKYLHFSIAQILSQVKPCSVSSIVQNKVGQVNIIPRVKGINA